MLVDMDAPVAKYLEVVLRVVVVEAILVEGVTVSQPVTQLALYFVVYSALVRDGLEKLFGQLGG